MTYCIFNGLDLNSNGYEVLDVNVGDMPSHDIKKYNLVAYDGEVVTGKYYGGRNIIISGRINASNRKDMDSKLDALKSYLVGQDKTLDIYVADVTRRFTATVDGFSTEKIGYKCSFEITLTANAFGKDISTTSLTFGTFTDGDDSYTNTFGGTYNAEPVIDFTVNMAVPYWSSSYIQFTNSVLNKRIRLTREWGWFDRVVIDCESKTCEVYPTTKTEIDVCDDVSDWTSSHTLSLEETNQLEGEGCLSVTMAGAGATTDFIRLDNTSLDLDSSAGSVIIPVYIPTPDAGTVASISFYAGSDATLADNYVYWTETTQWDGSAIDLDAWNYFEIDLSDAVTGDSGTADRDAIISIKIAINGTDATMQLDGVMIDYLTLQKASVVSEVLDYEGTFVDFTVGSGTLNVTDELDARDIDIAGYYTKRYL